MYEPDYKYMVIEMPPENPIKSLKRKISLKKEKRENVKSQQHF